MWIALLAAWALAGDPAVNLARYKAPKGWSLEQKASGVDSVVVFAKDTRRIRVRHFGLPGSKYAAPQDFLDGLEAKSQGRLAEKARELTVAGAKRTVYRRTFAAALGNPHERPQRVPAGVEEYCVVPARDGFFVLSYSDEIAHPEPAKAPEKTWLPFLKSFRLRKS